jgi:hypothetical protein
MGNEMVVLGTKAACDGVNATRVGSSAMSTSLSIPASQFDSTKQLAFRTSMAAAVNLNADQLEILSIQQKTIAGNASNTSTSRRPRRYKPMSVGTDISFRFINLLCSQISSVVANAQQAVTSGALASVGVLPIWSPPVSTPNPNTDTAYVPFNCPGQAGSNSSALLALCATAFPSPISVSCSDDDRQLWRRVAIAFIVLFCLSFVTMIILVVLLIREKHVTDNGNGNGNGMLTTRIMPQ